MGNSSIIASFYSNIVSRSIIPPLRMARFRMNGAQNGGGERRTTNLGMVIEECCEGEPNASHFVMPIDNPAVSFLFTTIRRIETIPTWENNSSSALRAPSRLGDCFFFFQILPSHRSRRRLNWNYHAVSSRNCSTRTRICGWKQVWAGMGF